MACEHGNTKSGPGHGEPHLASEAGAVFVFIAAAPIVLINCLKF